MAVMVRRYRFTVDEYERLAQARVLTQCDRTELLDGEIVEMTSIGDRHASVVARLTSLFEIFRQPTLAGYRAVEALARDERLTPQAFPDLSLTVADLLG